MRLCLFTAHMGTFVLGKKGGGLLPTEGYFLSFFFNLGEIYVDVTQIVELLHWS